MRPSITKPVARAKSSRTTNRKTPGAARQAGKSPTAPTPTALTAADLASVRGLAGALAALRYLAARMGRLMLGEKSSRAACTIVGGFYGILVALVAIVDGWGTQAAIDAAEDVAARARDLGIALRALVPAEGEPRAIPPAVHRVDDITGAIVDARRALDDLCAVGEDAALPKSAQAFTDHAAKVGERARHVLRALRTAENAATEIVEAPALAACILDPRTHMLHGFELVDERHDGRGFVIVKWQNDPAAMARALTHALCTVGDRNVLAAAAKLLPAKDVPAYAGGLRGAA
jgi:hypothetical protein